MSAATAQPSPIKLRWFFGIIGTFLIFAVIAAYSSRMAQDTSDYDAQRAAARYDTLAKLRADDDKTLTTADWVDQAKGTVRIPINEAIPQTLTALKSKPVQMGAAIPGATPPSATTKPNTVPAAAENNAPAGGAKASPSTNAAPAAPTPPTAPNK